jgi:hypothetical protein
MPLSWRPRLGETRREQANETPMIANGRVRGALPALGQPKTPATIPHSDRLGKEFRHRSFQAGVNLRVPTTEVVRVARG